MEELRIEDIDRFHDDLHGKLNKYLINDIYDKILSNPLKYLLSNGYLKKLFIYTILPFISGVVAICLYQKSGYLFNKYFALLVVLVLIWLWFNKNTCFVLLKLLMFVCAIFPSMNYPYCFTGQLLHVRTTKGILCILFLVISIQLTLNIVCGFNI